ncbi:uncharacterized protein B0H18DRAFT_625805 [Fomitopsis serialis]|uniref:uncharacterized protein n=1 Tax=Fomitopsis serialis TaxID=139415 RepID=UPI0020071E49|nr:uncharacterized protein B0H18DRAFT_625805 [Neoantrodia serialis]KAH9919708.1 hypothetical protein B0H18DRAFT_625805 [Neoantrodia serialis]
MSTLTRHLFILWAPFSRSPGTTGRWASSRSAHRATLDPLIASGTIKLAGPVLSPEADLSKPHVELEKFGTVLVYQGETLESVRKLVETDPFYTEGVWDRDRLQLHPMVNVA